MGRGNYWRWVSTVAQVRRNSVTCTKDAFGRVRATARNLAAASAGTRGRGDGHVFERIWLFNCLDEEKDGKTRSFCGVGCTTVLRFDFGRCVSRGKQGLFLRQTQGEPSDAGGEPTMSRTGSWRIAAARWPVAARRQSVYYYTLYFLRCQVEKCARRQKSSQWSVVGGQLSRQ
jgi:hypothetical protein